MGIRIQKILWADVRTYCSKFCMLYSALEQDGFYTTAYIISMRNERFVSCLSHGLTLSEFAVRV